MGRGFAAPLSLGGDLGRGMGGRLAWGGSVPRVTYAGGLGGGMGERLGHIWVNRRRLLMEIKHQCFGP